MAALLRLWRARGLSISTQRVIGSLAKRQNFDNYHSLLQGINGCNKLSIKSISSQKWNTNNSRELEAKATLDQLLLRLDMGVRRTGRISRAEVTNVFKEIENLKYATPTQSLLLLRCCGTLMAEEHPEQRKKLVDEVWKFLTSENFSMDVSHYNALLKVCIENSSKISDVEFLELMEKNGIEPNRVTYQRFIEKFCNEGDIDGAGKILQVMKDKDMAINEAVFNALIIGHSKSNDMDGAKNIIDVMKNAKLEPSVDTYTNLLCGYAEKGDLQSLHEILADLDSKQFFLSDSNYFKIIVTLTKYGYSQNIEEILNKCSKSLGYNQESINNAIYLMNLGYNDVAYKILKAMPNLPKDKSENSNAGQFFLRQLVMTERSVDEILKFCNKMHDDNINLLGLVRSAELAYLLDKPAIGVQLVLKMIEQGTEARAHLFWPALAAARDSKNVEAATRIIRIMGEANCVVSFETFMDYIFPTFDLTDPILFAQKLKHETKISISSIISPLITYLLLEQRLQEAVDLISMYPTTLNGYNIIRPLVSLANKQDNLEHVLKILARTRDIANYRVETPSRSDWNGNFLLQCFQISDHDVTLLESIAQEMLSKKLFISQNVLDNILSRSDKQIPSHLLELLDQLVSEDLNKTPEELTGIPHPKDMSLEELETHYIELKNKNMNVRGIVRKILMQYCRLKNLDRVNDMLVELNEDIDLPSAVHSSLIDLYSHHNKLDEALKHKKLLDEKDPFFPIDDYKILNLARVYVFNSRIEDAIELMKSHHDKHLVRTNNSMQRNAWRIMNIVADNGDVESTDRLFDTIIECDFCEPNNLILGPLIKARIQKDDIDGALVKFEECCKKYRNTPWKNELLIQFIKREDTENLKKIMDLSSEIHGEMNVLYDLAFAFNECGKLNQAKKILETPGLRAKLSRLDPICERYLLLNKVTELENLLRVTKGLFGIDRDRMFFYLVRVYCKQGDVQKALGVWTSMQEENVQPSATTLKYLADFLKNNNHPVPFAIPEQYVSNTPTNNQFGLLRQYIRENKCDEAIDLKRVLDIEGKKLNAGLSSNLLRSLIIESRINDARSLVVEMLSNNMYPYPSVFKTFVVSCAKLGDVEFLNDLKPKLPDLLRNSSIINSAIGNAYVNSGQHQEFLQLIESDEHFINYFPLSAFHNMLKNHPETEEKAMEIAKKIIEDKENVKPMNMIWIHNFINGNFEKTDKLLEDYPSMGDTLLYMAAADDVIDNADENKAQRLLDIVEKLGLPCRMKAGALGAYISVLVKNNKIDEALAKYETAISQGEYLQTDFSRKTVDTLTVAAQHVGKSIYTNKPTSELSRKDDADLQSNSVHSDESSSSGSDSSSDEEIDKQIN